MEREIRDTYLESSEHRGNNIYRGNEAVQPQTKYINEKRKLS